MLPADWTAPGRGSLSPRTGPEPFAARDGRLGKWLSGSLALHGGVVVVVLAAGAWAYLHRGSTWGGSAVNAGAIEAKLVSAAPALPIPSPQTPTDNVLATENPSPQPVPPQPAPKAAEPPPDAVPIPEKVNPPKAKAEPKEQKPEPKATNTKTATASTPKNIVIPKPENRVPMGEAAAANIPRSNPNAATGNNPVNVGGDFGSRFPWYVTQIKQKAAQNWYRAEVAPNTPAGARVFLTFDIAKDGHPGNVRVEKSSGSATLDTSAIRALQRVDTFGPLPGGYSGNRLSVEYYFEY